VVLKAAAMYQIIGADGNPYGPVSAEQFRQWMREGRVNHQTQVRAEGATEWKPAATVPGLVDVFSSATGVPPRIGAMPPAVNRAHNKVAAGVCGIVLGGMGVHKFILGYTGAGLTMLLVNILTCGIGGIVMHVIGLIEGIIYLTRTDEEFVRIYVDGRKEWF
jgi:TM2 domain-containing membrane protein YozV